MDTNHLLEESTIETFLAAEEAERDEETLNKVLKAESLEVRLFWFQGLADWHDEEEGEVELMEHATRVLPLFAEAILLHAEVTEKDIDAVLKSFPLDADSGIEFLCEMGDSGYFNGREDRMTLEAARRFVTRFVDVSSQTQLIQFVEKLGAYCQSPSYDEVAQWAVVAFEFLVNGGGACPAGDHRTLAIVVDHASMCGAADSAACELALERLDNEDVESQYLVKALAARDVFFNNENSDGGFNKSTLNACWERLKARNLATSGDDVLSADVLVTIYRANEDDAIGEDAARIFAENFGGDIDDFKNN